MYNFLIEDSNIIIMLLSEYFSIFIFLCVSIVLTFVFMLLAYIIVYQKYDVQKLSSYECGFQPFDDARSKFDIRFYLVGILFIIFDLEVSFLFPWAVYVHESSIIGVYSMFLFLIILTIGFVYEWKKGALEWE